MEIYKLISNDAFLNLATEEFFLKNNNQPIFLIWQNSNAIIIGRNQDAHSEINALWVKENDTKVVRRITGGGSVYHDLGNVNFSIIIRKTKYDKSLVKYLQDIIDFLKSINIDAYFSGRNDILYKNKKISGVASTIYNDSLLIHGTLLFDIDVEKMVNSLNVSQKKVSSKGIKSIRSRVDNLSNYLKMDINSFIEKFILFLEKKYNTKYKIFDSSLNDEINLLSKNKFSSIEWNYGKNFDFNFDNEIKIENGIYQIKIEVENNLIKNIKMFSDSLDENIDFSPIENKLLNVEYDYEIIKKLILDNKIYGFNTYLNNDQFLELLFKNS